jgi:hypothetical protein
MKPVPHRRAPGFRLVAGPSASYLSGTPPRWATPRSSSDEVLMKPLRSVAIPSLVVLLMSCGDREGTGIVYLPTGSRDMNTGFSADPAADDYPLWVDLNWVPQMYVSAETLRVVRWPAGDVVPGEWRRADVAYHYNAVTLFYPDSPLAPGWYAVQFEMPDWNYRFAPPGIREGDLETLRVHLGPLPTVRLYRAPEPGSYFVEVSENIVVDADYDMLEFVDYRFDGVRRVCLRVSRHRDHPDRRIVISRIAAS